MKGYYIRYVPALDDFYWYINTGEKLIVLNKDWISSRQTEITDEFEFVCDLEGNETPEGYYIKDFEHTEAGLYRYMNGELMVIDTSSLNVNIAYVQSMYASPEKEYGFTFAFDLELRR